MGMPVGASGVTEELARFLPSPTVERDGDRFYLDHDRPDSIGKVRAFHGVPATVVRSYAWVLALGAEGLREVAEIAVLNNNYLAKKVAEIQGIAVSYADGNDTRRLEQIRYSLAKLKEDTGIGTLDVARRTSDFGVAQYFPSHEPWVVEEPMTLEPAETVSRADLDTYVGDPRPDLGRGLLRPGGDSLVPALEHRAPDRPRAARRPRAVGADLARVGQEGRPYGLRGPDLKGSGSGVMVSGHGEANRWGFPSSHG